MQMMNVVKEAVLVLTGDVLTWVDNQIVYL